MSEQSRNRRIVVGVDGSPASVAALRWAVRQAELTGATVEAVTAWHYPTVVGGFAWAPVANMEAADLQESAEKTLAEVISTAVDPASDVRIRIQAGKGTPVKVLLAAAAGADLLVVGASGHGGLTGALLGSVSRHCVQHAPGAVAVIRGTRALC
jgi:nucleotide-binding universal stress UspA family protein